MGNVERSLMGSLGEGLLLQAGGAEVRLRKGSHTRLLVQYRA